MRAPSFTTLMTSAKTPFVFVLLGITLVGVGLGLWIDLGSGLAAGGVGLSSFGYLLGRE